MKRSTIDPATKEEILPRCQQDVEWEGIALGLPWTKHLSKNNLEYSVAEMWIAITSSPLAQDAGLVKEATLEEKLLAEVRRYCRSALIHLQIDAAKKAGDFDRVSALMQKLWSGEVERAALEQPEQQQKSVMWDERYPFAGVLWN